MAAALLHCENGGYSAGIMRTGGSSMLPFAHLWFFVACLLQPPGDIVNSAFGEWGAAQMGQHA